ncbi:MAG: MBL fold metallo-hydrolase [Acidobacteriaceae bacterium]|nr:MBL fold metallo-hydrolase [Acidobacteriaceae bacterium]
MIMAKPLTEIAEGVFCLEVGIANVYFVGKPGSTWVLVDTGVAGKVRTIVEAAESRYGQGAQAACILLTHGHQDHTGNAQALADLWKAPVYAHPLEMPYLRGAEYPPLDPTAPGFLSFMSRFIVVSTQDLGDRVRPLEEGSVPVLEHWSWHHTPGHTPGHVAYFRNTDATLLAGDAFATVNSDSLFSILAKKREISRPPTPSTTDWAAAAESVKKLDQLNPLTFACGHGVPMSGADAAREFERFVDYFPFPEHGRYARESARADERGVVSLPPAPPDNKPGVVGAASIAAVTGVMFAVAAQRRKKRLLNAGADPNFRSR